MKQSIFALSIGALVLGGILAFPNVASAYRGDPAVKGPNHTEAREQAIETANLASFTASCTTGRICDVVDTQEELNTLRDMHLAVEKGDLAKAQQLRTKLGLGLRNGSGRGTGMNRWNQ